MRELKTQQRIAELNIENFNRLLEGNLTEEQRLIVGSLLQEERCRLNNIARYIKAALSAADPGLGQTPALAARLGGHAVH